MDKKILITREIPNLGIGMLKEKGFTVVVCPGEVPLSQEQIISFLKEDKYDGVVTLLTDKIDKTVLDSAPSVKIFANYATGYNNIDIVEAKSKGVVVTNTPGVSALSVAEHAIALILALTTRTVEGDRFVRAGKYKGWSAMNLIGTDLKSKTVGLIGVGNIGSQIAQMLYKAFDAKIVYYDVNKNEFIENEYKAKRFETVEELLKNSDIVSLHVPLLDSTRHLINEERLKMMKPTAFLVNTSRGEVVDEKSLVRALQDKTIRGAGLDVFEFEPELSDGLSQLENVVLTPHIASARESARDDMARLVAQNIIDFFDGKTPANKIV